jgi:hypothetical protein
VSCSYVLWGCTIVRSEATDNGKTRREHCPGSRLTLPLHLVVIEGELSTVDVSRTVALEDATSERRERCRRIFQRGVAKVLANIPDVKKQITSPAD